MARTVRQLKKAARIILVGAPGVGKGTQTERLIKRYPQLASISSGDLLRENVRSKTPLGSSFFLEGRGSSSLSPVVLAFNLTNNTRPQSGIHHSRRRSCP